MNIRKIVNKLFKGAVRKSALLKRQVPTRVDMQMSNLVQAALNALDPDNSDRLNLLDIYSNSWKDSQVISEHEKAEAFLITEPFEICKEGSDTPDRKRTMLLNRPWFTQFLTIAMDTEFWGYQLAEFGVLDINGEFMDVKVFPREHIRPF